MVNIPAKDINFKPLTPERAQEYLQKKPQYLAIWKSLIPKYFEANEFCHIINTIRTKRIDANEQISQKIGILEHKKNEKGLGMDEIQKLQQLNDQKKDIFSETLRGVFGSLVSPRIKNTGIGYKEVNQLIGSLSNISKTKMEEIQEFTTSVNKGLHENLSKLETYQDEISSISEDLQQQYFTNKGLGGNINESEIKQFNQQAVSIFLQNHQLEIHKTIDIRKLNSYLHSKNII